MKEHPQAEILRAIADGKTVQIRNLHTDENWFTPTYAAKYVDDPNFEFRIKPKTITINGHGVPKPVREPLENGDKYWMPDIKYPDTYLYNTNTWNGCVTDVARLKNGVIHLTKEAAIAHAEALLSFTRSEK